MKRKNIFNTKEHKLTRRRVMNLATGAGFSTLTAAQMTVDDVKAAASDEVTVPIDTEGEYKIRVSEDWHERVRDAREANKRMKQRFSERNGVVSVGYSPGDMGGENPSVRVGIDPDHDEADERRGELPERENRTPVRPIDEKPGEAHCNPEYTDRDNLPGGLPSLIEDNDIDSENVFGTMTSRLINGSRWQRGFGWATAAHTLPDPKCVPDDFDGLPILTHQTQSDPEIKEIGRVWFFDQERDIVAVEATGNAEPVSSVARPDQPDSTSSWHDISGTLSQDGAERVAADDNLGLVLRGKTSCQSSGNITALDASQRVCGDIYHCHFCGESISRQTKGDYPADEGDSGSLVYTDPIPQADNKRFASHLHSGSSTFGDSYGPSGFGLREDRNFWWDDL